MSYKLAETPAAKIGTTGSNRGPGGGRRCAMIRRCAESQGLPLNAVVHRLALDAPGVNVLAPTDAVRFRQLERARFTPFVHSGLTRTRKRSVVRGRKVCAPADESRTSQDYPFHVRVSRAHAWRTNAESGRAARGASDVHRGVWIQAPTLLGQRELVGTVANIPDQRGCAGLSGQSAPAPRACLYSHTVKLAKATIPPIIMAARMSIVVTASRIMTASLPLHLSLRRELSHGANAGREAEQ